MIAIILDGEIITALSKRFCFNRFFNQLNRYRVFCTNRIPITFLKKSGNSKAEKWNDTCK